MKVLVVGKFYDEGFALHISRTLKLMGHTTIEFEVGQRLVPSRSVAHHRFKQISKTLFDIYAKTPRYSSVSLARFQKVVDRNEIDLTISCHDFLTPKEVRLLKAGTNGPVAIWFPDAVSNFGKAMFLDADYDFLFFKEPFIVDILRREFAFKAFYLPECCNPQTHRTVDITDKDREFYGCDISTAGNLHTARSAIFKLLSDYNVKIWGNPPPAWMILGPISKFVQYKFVSNDEKSKSFLASKIVLNSIHPTEIYGVNVRLFEIAACGAFQLISWREGLSDLYDVGTEIIAYRSISDLKDKINFFLENASARTALGQLAQRRTLSEHTYAHRLNLMIDTVAGKASGFPMRTLHNNSFNL